MKTLIAYFSVGGRPKKVANAIKKVTEGELFEVVPVEPYSEGDIKWMNPLARCNKEKIGKKDVPVARTIQCISDSLYGIMGHLM